jgi:hypothetical protein
VRLYLLVAVALLTGLTRTVSGNSSPVYRINHVVDGDTIALRNGLEAVASARGVEPGRGESPFAEPLVRDTSRTELPAPRNG